MTSIPRLRRPLSLLVASVLSGAAPMIASADEGDAFNFTVGQTITRDDNLLRLPDNAAVPAQFGTSSRSDAIYTTYAGIVFDRRYSRQRIRAEAFVNDNRFDNYSVLNFVGSNAKADWGWELGNRWKGDVIYENLRRLVDFGEVARGGANVSNEQDVFTYNRLYANADYWWHPNWSNGLAVARASSRYSSERRAASEHDADVVELNGKYRPRSGNQIGATLRRTEGDYPNRETPFGTVATVDNSYSQTDAELNGFWQVTGNSRLSGRAGYTRREHDEVGQRDFSGVTARFVYDWMLTGKTSVNFTARREIGAVEDLTASYVLTKGIAIAPTWKPTEKTSLGGKIDWRKRDYQGDPGFAQGVEGERRDKVRTYGIVGTWIPWRALQFSLSWQRENRTSTIPAFEYDDDLYSLSAQFTF